MKFHIIFALIASFIMVSCKPIDEENILLDYALSPDGATLAIYWDTGVYLYDLATMDKSSFIKFDNGDYSLLRTSGAITISHDEEPDLYGSNSGAIAFSHDGKQIAVSGKFADEPIRIWDIDSQKQIATVSNSLTGYYVTEIEFSPNSESIVVRNTHTNAKNCQGYVEDKIILHNVNKNEELFEVDKCTMYPPTQFLFTTDETLFFYLGTMSSEYELYFIDSNTGESVSEDCEWDQNERFFGSSPQASIYLLKECIPDSSINEMIGKAALFINQNSFVFQNYSASMDKDQLEFWENDHIKCIYDGVGFSAIKPSANGEVFARTHTYREQDVYQQEIQIWDVSTCTMINTLQFD